jgi:hypothetical protein
MRCDSFPSPASLLERAIAFLRRNPKSTLAGLAAIAAAFWPERTAQISSIAAGVGLILASDAK